MTTTDRIGDAADKMAAKGEGLAHSSKKTAAELESEGPGWLRDAVGTVRSGASQVVDRLPDLAEEARSGAAGTAETFEAMPEPDAPDRGRRVAWVRGRHVPGRRTAADHVHGPRAGDLRGRDDRRPPAAHARELSSPGVMERACKAGATQRDRGEELAVTRSRLSSSVPGQRRQGPGWAVQSPGSQEASHDPTHPAGPRSPLWWVARWPPATAPRR